MKTPYVPHIFGEEVNRRLTSKRGWLTAGVASSIPWPSQDVCITYAGDDYFLRGSERDGKPSPPCITIAYATTGPDAALAKIYRFTSILSWFEGGYVDVSGYIHGSHPALYGSRTVYSSLGIAGTKSFNCNHMPIIDDDNVRRALAFWREGKRLDEVHDSYSFLSFYKVIESQFAGGKGRAEWITANIDKLTGRAAQRVTELRAQGVDVSRHLYESGRCAVAHATLEGEIVDPDIPADRRRLSADLVMIEELARNYIRDELKVPDARSLYRTRDRLEPWATFIEPAALRILKEGGTPTVFSGLTDKIVSVGIWPDGPIPGLERMSLHLDAIASGVVKIVLINDRKKIFLVFFLDFSKGRIHTNLEDGGLISGNEAETNEDDVRAYATFFYKVFSNGIAELTCGDKEPVDCDVVIPVNVMITKSADEAIADEVENFRKRKSNPAPGS
jgi:hypothetical protein